MALTLDQLRQEVLALAPEQRKELLSSLSHELGNEPPSLHPAWAAELDRRSEELRSGKVKGIPAEEIFREIDELVERP